ncbi:putative quinol monooxygenase [Streptomyces mirabilis]|uniref:putative quinol monooxygenase n=1 Tax=Streptomyces mirabilis TaxID=68239 RepID=UPI0036930B35
MIVLNVFFDVAQEHEANFLKLLNRMVVESIKEDGCSLYQLWRNDHDPYSYALSSTGNRRPTLTRTARHRTGSTSTTPSMDI